MTLITFHSRIHFASDVLEEALRAELEESQHRNLLVIADASDAGRSVLDRVNLGIPDRVERHLVSTGVNRSKLVEIDRIVSDDANRTFDAIVACGSSRAIALGRKCRHRLASARYSQLPKKTRRTQSLRKFLPDFFVIPGVDGMPDPCMAGGSMAAEKTTPPSVIICDPSLLVDSSHADVASAFAIALGRCFATLAESSFNPLADGMAVEGLRRLAMTLPLAPEKKLLKRQSRDLMAASLNGSISQQKGPGLVQAIASSLTELTQCDVDNGSLQRILLPRLLRDLHLISRNDEALIMRVLDIGGQTPLADSIERILDPLPLNRSFRDMGYGIEDLQQAITAATAKVHMSEPVAEQLKSIVREVY